MQKVLITGITGFVGSHLADLCLDQNLEVFGVKRYHLSNTKNISHVMDKIHWFDCDLFDPKYIVKVIAEIKPDIIFHMASQSFVSPSWDHPSLYMDANYKMTINLMEACIQNKINPRILIPGSGEEYGEIYESELPINEATGLRPVNPYAVTKIAQDLIAYVYFRSYGLNIIRTRAFNHEGPRRDKVFGIPWYAYQVSQIEKGLQEPIIQVGHIDDKRNFTHVKDMVRAYWLAVQKCKPGELYLVGAEKNNHVYTFKGALERLIGMSTYSGKISYQVNSKYVRPTNVPFLICDSSKFVNLTGWQPTFSFEDILLDTLNYWRYGLNSCEKVNSQKNLEESRI